MNYDKLYKGALIAVDCAVLALVYWLSFLLRFDLHVPPHELGNMLGTMAFVLLIKIVVFERCGLYRGLWRYAGMNELFSIIRAVFSSQVLVFAFVLFVRHADFPRSILIIDTILTLLAIGMVRFTVRLVRELRDRRKNTVSSLPQALIFGAGDLGEMVLRELARSSDRPCHVIGFIDDNAEKWHYRIHGVAILGGRTLIPELIEKRHVSEIIIAVNSARGPIIKDLLTMVSAVKSHKVELKIVPTVEESLTRNIGTPLLRKPVIDDLLQRKPVTLDMAAIHGAISGKTVLVTGAGGSIGSEFCRQVLKYNPRQLLMLDNNNTALFYIEREIRAMKNGSVAVPVVGDIRDKALLEKVFNIYAPKIIFHAAAHKHVPLLELNPHEAIKNNTLATMLLAETAIKYNAERFLNISTDKAVSPSSVMGASKRLGEMVIRALSGTGSTKMISVRFGNVLGSSGSVVRIFQDQINKGGPVTVTDTRATRYLMTTSEAVQLIMQACAMGNGGEIFVLNMGKPIRILELAENLIVLNGLRPGIDIKIVTTGLRPGEKLHEALFAKGEVCQSAGHSDIFMVTPKPGDAKALGTHIDELRELSQSSDAEGLLRKIQEIIPSYGGCGV